MPLISCHACRSRTPSSSTRCVHCGALPPVCPDCGGTGTCPACAGSTAPVVIDSTDDRVCGRCSGNNVCPGCSGQRRRWAATV